MRDRGFAEWVLKRTAGAERGTAIYGDLVELRATRGGAWFWMAYIRTLLLLTWRTPIAFVGGLLALVMLYRLRLTMMMHLSHASRASLFANPNLLRACSLTAFELWFLIPFAAVKYGLRDRMVQLGFAICLIASGGSILLTTPAALVSLGAAVMAAIAAVVFSEEWRDAGVAVATAAATGVAALFALFPIARFGARYLTYRPSGLHSQLFVIFLPATWVIVILDLVIVSFVATGLHSKFAGKGMSHA